MHSENGHSREPERDVERGLEDDGERRQDDTVQQRFWERIALDDMSDEQWESLCDGCGRCCLQKLEDEDTGEVHFTDIACRLLDTDRCRCSRYPQRFRHVPDCLAVRPLDDEKLSWLPSSCAYRRLALGQGLPLWHPLISGDPDSVRRAGIGMHGRCSSEQNVPLELWVHRVVVFES